jgi:hypothetical protein
VHDVLVDASISKHVAAGSHHFIGPALSGTTVATIGVPFSSGRRFRRTRDIITACDS